jgi:hypothetical protein
MDCHLNWIVRLKVALAGYSNIILILRSGLSKNTIHIHIQKYLIITKIINQILSNVINKTTKVINMRSGRMVKTFQNSYSAMRYLLRN